MSHRWMGRYLRQGYRTRSGYGLRGRSLSSSSRSARCLGVGGCPDAGNGVSFGLGFSGRISLSSGLGGVIGGVIGLPLLLFVSRSSNTVGNPKFPAKGLWPVRTVAGQTFTKRSRWQVKVCGVLTRTTKGPGEPLLQSNRRLPGASLERPKPSFHIDNLSGRIENDRRTIFLFALLCFLAPGNNACVL